MPSLTKQRRLLPKTNQMMQNPRSIRSISAKYVPASIYGKSSKYLGVHKVMDKEAYIATAYLISKQAPGTYLGTFVKEEDAARAYDLVSIKLGFPPKRLNFPIEDYTKPMNNLTKMSLEELISFIRKSSITLAKGKSPRFYGVFRFGQTGKWQARIELAGKEHTFGLFETEEAAAVAYDMACIREKGYQAVTNYSLRCYDVKSIFSENKFQQQAMNAIKLQHQATEMQAMNAMKVWQKATDMQAIEARKIQKQAMDFEASRRLAFQKQQQQQPEDDPLLALTLATRNTNLTKPIACRRRLECENQGTEGLRRYFVAWALKTTREELASGSSKKFNHGKFSPFCSYQEMKQSKERPKPFDLFGPPDKGYYVPPFEEWLGGLGSKHGNSGVLRHYKNDQEMKGKAKVGYDV